MHLIIRFIYTIILCYIIKSDKVSTNINIHMMMYRFWKYLHDFLYLKLFEFIIFKITSFIHSFLGIK